MEKDRVNSRTLIVLAVAIGLIVVAYTYFAADQYERDEQKSSADSRALCMSLQVAEILAVHYQRYEVYPQAANWKQVVTDAGYPFEGVCGPLVEAVDGPITDGVGGEIIFEYLDSDEVIIYSSVAHENSGYYIRLKEGRVIPVLGSL